MSFFVSRALFLLILVGRVDPGSFSVDANHRKPHKNNCGASRKRSMVPEMLGN